VGKSGIEQVVGIHYAMHEAYPHPLGDQACSAFAHFGKPVGDFVFSAIPQVREVAVDAKLHELLQ